MKEKEKILLQIKLMQGILRDDLVAIEHFNLVLR
jgi:hypothetical protein